MDELFRKAIAALETYARDGSLEVGEQRALAEAIARLKDVRSECSAALEANNKLLESDENLREMREFMSGPKLWELLGEQAKVDPQLAEVLAKGPLKQTGGTEVSSFDMTSLDENVPAVAEDIRALQKGTESVYQSLWVIKGRLNQTPRFKNFNPTGVRDVRNHLIEHTDGKGSGADIYSFGIATGGPVLRPVKPTGVNAPHDAGFSNNLTQFLERIAQ